MSRHEEIVLTQSWRSALGSLAFSVLLVAGGVWMATAGEGRAWFVLPFGVVFFVLSFLQLFRPDQLVINDEGFGRRRTPLGGRGYWKKWHEVSPFRVSGGRGGPRVSYALVLDPHKRDPEHAPRYSSYGQLPRYDISPTDLADHMNQRRDAVVDEELRSSRVTPPADVSQAEVNHVPWEMSDDLLSIYFEQSADGRRPAVSGSFVVMARSRVSAKRIARQLGEPLVTGIVDGEPEEACVIQATAARLPMVFLSDGFGSKVLMQAGSDYEAGYRIVEGVSRGKSKRVKS